MTVAHAVLFCNLTISIHMPHTWHDGVEGQCLVVIDISIHMPHTWHDGNGPGF